MDKDLKEFLKSEGIHSGMSIRGIVSSILKFFLYILVLVAYLLVLGVKKIGNGIMSVSYGILKPCARCVWGKSRESLIIVSGHGYSRDDRVLIVMNHAKKNWIRRGECVGFSECGKCLNEINIRSGNLPCKWK